MEENKESRMLAFPATDGNTFYTQGMELRDYFANSAMNGIVSENPTKTIDYIARRSYEITDAMLKQREL